MTGFEKSFASGDISIVKLVIIEALLYVHKNINDLSVEKEYDLKLALGEILLNAVIHGNHQSYEKKVHLKLDIKDCVVTIKVTDEGGGFDHKALMAGFEKDDHHDKEHGRGVRLAAALMDEFAFNEKGNEIVCSKRVVAYE